MLEVRLKLKQFNANSVTFIHVLYEDAVNISVHNFY